MGLMGAPPRTWHAAGWSADDAAGAEALANSYMADKRGGEGGWGSAL